MNTKKPKSFTAIAMIFAVMIVADLCFSFYQHYHMPVGGDMAEVIMPFPDHGYYKVLHDPFGLNALLKQESYPNPNRFFAHWSASTYFLNIPFLFQRFTDPVSSLYWSAALIKTITQALIIFLLAVHISNSFKINDIRFLLAAVLVTPFFQAFGFCRTLGIIDQSVIYTFFYALPLGLLLLFFLPFFRMLYYRQAVKINPLKIIMLTGLVIILSLNGPLVPGVVLIICPLILAILYVQNYRMKEGGTDVISRVLDPVRRIPPVLLFLFLLFSVMSLYSLYIGRYNSLNDSVSVSIIERYTKIPEGLYNLFTKKLAFPLLLGIIMANYMIIRMKFRSGEGNDILRLMNWFLFFALIYIFLLPLGGYRQYRANIVRYDTIMPITLGLVFLFGKTSLYLTEKIQGRIKTGYIALLASALIIFTIADKTDKSKYVCEKNAIHQIAISTESIVKIQDDCPVLDWKIIRQPEGSAATAEFLHYLKITKEKKLFFQE